MFDKVYEGCPKKRGLAGDMQQYLTVTTAANFLGVSPSTLRNWDREGKLKAVRHPINRYRLYSKPELKRLLKRMRAK
jgi:MerR family transcriptional regulator, copper efflux regulator